MTSSARPANPQLAGSSVGKNEIATAAVGNDDIQSLAVDTSEIAYDAVNRSKLGGGGEPVGGRPARLESASLAKLLR